MVTPRGRFGAIEIGESLADEASAVQGVVVRAVVTTALIAALGAAGGAIVVKVRAADTPLGLASQMFITVSDGVDFSLVGRYIEVQTTLQAGDGGASPVLSDISIATANEPPVADAGGDYEVPEGGSIMLDALNLVISSSSLVLLD